METVIAFLLGLMAGLVAFALVLPTLNKRVRAQHQGEIQSYEQALAELRQERADDRETNRRLRRELAINTPDSLQATKEERDRALDELDQLNDELRRTTSELADRDRSLREARLAIHDIRVQLERDRYALDGHETAEEPVPETIDGSAGGTTDDTTGEVVPGPETDTGAGELAYDAFDVDPDLDPGDVDVDDELIDLEPALYDPQRTGPAPAGRPPSSVFFDDYPVGGSSPS